MSEQVVFYQLSHKFVDEQAVIPENSRQVIYYSLAIGHHLGVLDCLTKVASAPRDAFAGWLNSLPKGLGRDKLAGVLKWGEIEINQSHIHDLLAAITDLPAEPWTGEFIHCLQNMQHEPAIYLMVRRQP